MQLQAFQRIAIPALMSAAFSAAVAFAFSTVRADQPATPAAPAIAEKEATVFGYKLHYREAGSGPVVILLHGLGGDGSRWSSTIAALQHDHRVIALDQIGFGESDKPLVNYNHALLAEFLVEFMNVAGIDKASIVGHSMGGFVGMQVAVHHPEKLDKLVLVDGGSLDAPPRSAHLVQIQNSTTLAETREYFELMFYDKSRVTDALVRDNYQRRMRAAYTISRMQEARANGVATVSESEAAKINTPTLILWGKQDALLPASDAEKLDRVLPNSKAVIIDKSGHIPQVEQADEFNRLLEGFLTEPGADRTSEQRSDDFILVEAESFANTGGWVVDQQFMDVMGSPYMLAHGLGEPVWDATTKVEFPNAGRYRVWVRTRDWVAPWKAPGAPGRFQLLINDKPLTTTFGAEGAAWHWQDGGIVDVASTTTLALHDLTGFEGRCDAILFSHDEKFIPPDGGPKLDAFRGKLLGWSQEPADGGDFDLVVVGGGIAGTTAAISAARLGLSVALIQDRPVLGGNGSSEVRVWPEGKTNLPPYPHIGDVVSELVRDRTATDGNAKSGDIYEDARKLRLARDEPNITLLLEHRVNQATAKNGRVQSVVTQHTRTGRRTRVTGALFLDSTGDGVLGTLVGADFEITDEGHMGVSNLWNVGDTTQNEFQIQCECKDTDALSMAFVQSKEPVPFPRCPWAVDLSDQPFPGRKGFDKNWNGKDPLYRLGGWFWESGFNKDPINDVEWMRDQNLRAMYGAWDALKNVDKAHPNHRLKWAAYIAGKRESRRLLGDVVLNNDDILGDKKFVDACFPCTWSIDLHLPDPKFADGSKGDEFISQAHFGKYEGPYWAPYRCLYSRNIGNLFMAGRDISVTHEALGAVRVMRTTGCMGEVVGMAASLCRKHDCSPRDVYAHHLDELRTLMAAGAGKKN